MAPVVSFRTLHQCLTVVASVTLAVGGLSAAAIAQTFEESESADSTEESLNLGDPDSLETRMALYQPQPIDLSPSAPAVSTVLPPTNLPAVEPVFPDAPVQPMRVVLRLSDRRVYVYRGEEIIESFPVAIGRAGWETPVGEFEVFSMIEDPGWTNPFTGSVSPPGPNNPLGDRWIAFWSDGNNMIGFHGTPNRDSVGRAASHGCVRLYNEDVRRLFTLVTVGTPVTVEQ